jgi:hypothetical protein
MLCPKCKKEIANDCKVCTECGFKIDESKKIAAGAMAIILLFLIFQIGGCVSESVDEVEANKNSITQEDIQKANDYIVTLKAAGLIKGVKNICADGSEGCYKILIDEYLWNNASNYETKENLIYASDIFYSSQKPYKYFEGIGYNSGKKLFNMFGIKN